MILDTLLLTKAPNKRLPVSLSVEAVEKVPKQILGRDAEKSDLIECARINNLMLGRVQGTPEDIVLTRQKYFSHRLVRRLTIL